TRRHQRDESTSQKLGGHWRQCPVGGRQGGVRAAEREVTAGEPIWNSFAESLCSNRRQSRLSLRERSRRRPYMSSTTCKGRADPFAERKATLWTFAPRT